MQSSWPQGGTAGAPSDGVLRIATNLMDVPAEVIGLLLIIAGQGARRRHGLGQGRTLDLDSRNLYSRRDGLERRQTILASPIDYGA